MGCPERRGRTCVVLNGYHCENRSLHEQWYAICSVFVHASFDCHFCGRGARCLTSWWMVDWSARSEDLRRSVGDWRHLSSVDLPRWRNAQGSSVLAAISGEGC